MKWWKLLDYTRQRIQKVVDDREPRSKRNVEGQHATPFSLAISILSAAFSYMSKPARDVRLLEPAVGLGVFYSCFLELTNGVMPKKAIGFEKDDELAAFADAIWGKVGLTVTNEDFTLVSPPQTEDGRFDLVITNPPYVRHHHLSTNDKKRLMDSVSLQLGVKPSGLMGLYGYFLMFGHNWMKKGGIGVWLVPHEFMDVKYGSVLRKYLTERVTLLRIHVFSIEDVQFDDAEVSSTVIFLRNELPEDNHEVSFTFGPSIQTPTRQILVPVNSLRNISKWSKFEKCVDVDIRSERTIRIGELFDVKRGLATGANDFFIMTLTKVEALKLPKRFLIPIIPSSRHLRNLEIIEADDSGMPKVKPRLFLLNCSLPRESLRENFPKLYGYILKGEERGVHKRYLTSKRNPWYKQEVRKPAPIMCSYMGRKSNIGKAIRFYRNKSKAVATNAYYMLYPKSWILQKVENLGKFCDLFYEALRSLDQARIIMQGRSYGGGLHKVEPKELEDVTVPFSNFLPPLREFVNKRNADFDY